MAQKLSRNTKGVRRQQRAANNRNTVRKATSHGRSFLGRMLSILPFSDEQLHRGFMVLILAGVVAGIWFLASISGATMLASERIGHAATNAGFAVKHVEVRGVAQMNEMRVYERALGSRDLAMTQVELTALREDIMTLPWVKDARVARQLPDTLVIDIVEREPHAVLARADRLMLIDATGVELEPVTREAAESRLLIKGPGAQSQVEALSHLLDAAPAMRQQVTGAEWVGNRRWDLTFRTGQKLALPEGPDKAAAALISFAKADGVLQLIGGDVASFDLRNAPRMYMSKPGSAEAREMELTQEEEG